MVSSDSGTILVHTTPWLDIAYFVIGLYSIILETKQFKILKVILVLFWYYSVYCVTETWLSSFVFDNEIFSPGYTIFREDRGTRGGGVLVPVKDSNPYKQIPSRSYLEVATVSICLSDPLILSLIYSPQ